MEEHGLEKKKNEVILITLDDLETHFNHLKSSQLLGIIFHLSRCGSTLTTQALSKIKFTRIISEPKIITYLKIALQDLIIDHRKAERILKVIVKLWFGDSNQKTIKNLIIKLSSWHTILFELFQNSFPKAPILFLIRNPYEILVSEIERPSQPIKDIMEDSVLASKRLFISEQELKRISIEEYIALSIQLNIQTVLEKIKSKTIVVDHKELPNSIFDKILPHFKMLPDVEELKDMEDRILYRGKKIEQKYKDDTSDKISKITPQMRVAINKYVDTVFSELLKLKEKNIGKE